MQNERTTNQNPSFSKLYSVIHNARRIIVLTHQRPDGDGIGAMFGLYHMFHGEQRTVLPVTQSTPGSSLLCIPGLNQLHHNVDPTQSDLIITLDAGEPGRIEFYDTAYTFKTLNIDHHPTERFAAYNYLDESVSSTSEIIADLCVANNLKISPKAATALLTGIFFDTGGFQFNTSQRTLTLIAHLLRAGAHLRRISQYLNHSTSPQALRVWGEALQNVNVEDSPSMAHTHIPHSVLAETRIDPKELQLDKLVQIVGSIREAAFGLLATEYEDTVFKGSFRTDAFRGVDVSRIAHHLGGGGHTYAAGFRYEGDYSKLLADISYAWQNNDVFTDKGSVAE